MAANSLNHFSSFVNQQINSLEAVNDNLAKANALIEVALLEGFLGYPESIIRDYLLMLCEIIGYAYNGTTTTLDAAFHFSREQKDAIISRQFSGRVS
jgi:hypothetical protein